MGLPGRYIDPATGTTYRTYTNAPAREEAANATAYYGVLSRNLSDQKLYYVVVRVSGEGTAVVWRSGPDAGSGDIRATPDGRLQVTWRLGQNEGAGIEWANVPGFVPIAPPVAEDLRDLIVRAFRALLSVEAFADWRRRMGWGE